MLDKLGRFASTNFSNDLGCKSNVTSHGPLRKQLFLAAVESLATVGSTWQYYTNRKVGAEWERVSLAVEDGNASADFGQLVSQCRQMIETGFSLELLVDTDSNVHVVSWEIVKPRWSPLIDKAFLIRWNCPSGESKQGSIGGELQRPSTLVTRIHNLTAWLIDQLEQTQCFVFNGQQASSNFQAIQAYNQAASIVGWALVLLTLIGCLGVWLGLPPGPTISFGIVVMVGWIIVLALRVPKCVGCKVRLNRERRNFNFCANCGTSINGHDWQGVASGFRRLCDNTLNPKEDSGDDATQSGTPKHLSTHLVKSFEIAVGKRLDLRNHVNRIQVRTIAIVTATFMSVGFGIELLIILGREEFFAYRGIGLTLGGIIGFFVGFLGSGVYVMIFYPMALPQRSDSNSNYK